MATEKNSKERATKKKRTDASSTVQKVAAGAVAAASAAAVSKAAKKSPAAAIAVIIALLLGVAAGYFGIGVLIKDDGFTMNGSDTAEVQMYEEYVDAGAKAIFLGKDHTSEIKVKYYYREDISHEAEECDAIDTAVAGFYYAEYQSDVFLYKGVKLIRTIEVVRIEDDGK